MLSKREWITLFILAILIVIAGLLVNVYANPLEDKVFLDKIIKAGFENKGNGIFVRTSSGDELDKDFVKKECLIIKHVYLKDLINSSYIGYRVWYFRPPEFIETEANIDRLIIEPVLKSDIEKIITTFRQKTLNKAKELLNAAKKKEILSKKGAKEA